MALRAPAALVPLYVTKSADAQKKEKLFFCARCNRWFFLFVEISRDPSPPATFVLCSEVRRSAAAAAAAGGPGAMSAGAHMVRGVADVRGWRGRVRARRGAMASKEAKNVVKLRAYDSHALKCAAVAAALKEDIVLDKVPLAVPLKGVPLLTAASVSHRRA